MQSTNFGTPLDLCLKTEDRIKPALPAFIKTVPMGQPDSNQDIGCSDHRSTMQSNMLEALDDQVLPRTEEVMIKTELLEESDYDQSKCFEQECNSDPTEYNLPDCTVPVIEYDAPPGLENEALQECDTKQNCGEFKFDQRVKREQSHRRAGVNWSEGEEPGGIRTDPLQQLARISDGRKTYFCQRCQYKTTNKPRIRTHLNRHNGEKAVKCTECSASFVRKSDLNRHMLIHSGLRPHECTVCSFRCGLASNLRRHIYRAHKKESS